MTTQILLWKTIESNSNRRLRVRVRFLIFYSELTPTDPWCNMPRNFTWTEKYEEVMSDEPPQCDAWSPIHNKPFSGWKGSRVIRARFPFEKSLNVILPKLKYKENRPYFFRAFRHCNWLRTPFFPANMLNLIHHAFNP